MLEWYVTLSRTEAKIFKRTSAKTSPKLIRTLTNPLGRERNAILSNDRPGTEKFRLKGGTLVSHAMNSEKNPHEDAAVQFVSTVAKTLDSECRNKSFDGLTIFSDPHMKGLLKEKLSKTTQKCIREWKRGNLSKMNMQELVRFLHATPVNLKASGSAV